MRLNMFNLAPDLKIGIDMKADTLDLTAVFTKIEASVNENKEIFEDSLMT